jgi:malate/lactate dehydrogenase
MPKVVIVGAGSVGTTIAYTLQITGVATEIVLIDVYDVTTDQRSVANR